jgi:hypothetical protein
LLVVALLKLIDDCRVSFVVSRIFLRSLQYEILFENAPLFVLVYLELKEIPLQLFPFDFL